MGQLVTETRKNIFHMDINSLDEALGRMIVWFESPEVWFFNHRILKMGVFLKVGQFSSSVHFYVDNALKGSAVFGLSIIISSCPMPKNLPSLPCPRDPLICN